MLSEILNGETLSQLSADSVGVANSSGDLGDLNLGDLDPTASLRVSPGADGANHVRFAEAAESPVEAVAQGLPHPWDSILWPGPDIYLGTL